MDIHYQDKYLIIINKEPGLMVEPDAHGYPNLQDKIISLPHIARKKNYVQPVHRIDRPVSGIVLFALMPSALKILNQQFAERQVEKIYLAITEHAPKISTGNLKHHLRKDALNKKAVVTDWNPKPINASTGIQVHKSPVVELDYEILETKQGLYLWKIHLKTGKYHQIRAQLAHIGCPILGDDKYGSTYKYDKEAIALHAHQLSFSHPFSNERMTITAAPPANKAWDLFANQIANSNS